MTSRFTVIVGSGVVAAMLARRILSNDPSSRVLILEAGGDYRVADYRRWLDFVMTQNSPNTIFEGTRSDADINADGGFQLVGGRMLVRGGSTNHWSGWCLRLKPEDFRLGEVRPGSANWPIAYEQIARYYSEAEEQLNVCGDSRSTTVPRFDSPFPHPPVPFTALDHLLIPTLEKLGYGYEAMPIARDPARCHTTGTCHYCPFDARYSAASDLSSLVAAFGDRLEVRMNSPVLSVGMRNRKSALGAVVVDSRTGESRVVEGDRVVIAAGTIESAKLLLASSSGSWPQGLGNESDQVGRHLVSHQLVRGVGLIPNNRKHLEQEIAFPTMACRHFDSEAYQAQGKMFFVRDGEYISIPIADKLISGERPARINSEIVSDTRMELRGYIEPFPDVANRVTLAAGTTKLGLPRTKIQYREAAETVRARTVHQRHLQEILYAAGFGRTPPLEAAGVRADHAAGTCRMSQGPNDGVVDRNLTVHGTDNVFVCSNAVFPNLGAVNPTLTLVALALRLGDHISPRKSDAIG